MIESRIHEIERLWDVAKDVWTEPDYDMHTYGRILSNHAVAIIRSVDETHYS
jgi:hypothetical protein